MGIKTTRKLFKAHESRAVVLPLNWVNFYGSRVDEVTIIGSDILLIVPEGLEQRADEIAAFIDSREQLTLTQSKGGIK